MQTTYIVLHQRPPQLEMPRLKTISELDHSSRDLPRGIFSNASSVARKKNGVCLCRFFVNSFNGSNLP